MSDLFNMRQTVLGCVSRLSSSFNTGTQNFVDVAINNAIIFAQRKCDFEWNKGVVRISCNPTGRIDQALEGANPVKLKKIIKALGLQDPGLANNRSLPYLSRTSQISDDTQRAYNQCKSTDPRVIHDGVNLYHTPIVEGPHDLYFYAVKWMPRLVKEQDTNFLLDYGFDFIMYRSIVELNFFIKEEERFQISSAMVGEAWNSLMTWDSSLISPTETEIEL
jgi:hypothetical protein